MGAVSGDTDPSSLRASRSVCATTEEDSQEWPCHWKKNGAAKRPRLVFVGADFFELERKVQRHLQEARAAQRVLDQAQL
jgi:hypothetical protein